MKNKMFSMKRQIVGASWFFIIVVAMLLIAFLTSSISSYQKKNDEKRSSEIIAYANTMEANLTQLRDVIGEIYSQNEYFNSIDAYPSVAERWNCIYNLLNMMRIQVSGNKNIGGLFLYYDSFEQVQYAINDNMNFASLEVIKKTGKAILSSQTKKYLTDIQRVDETVWMNIYMKKDASAIGGSMNLIRGLPDKREEGAIYGVIADGKFYCTGRTIAKKNENQEKVMELQAGEEVLNDIQIESLQSGKNNLDGNIIYLHQIDSANMSVIEILPDTVWLHLNWFHIIFMLLIVLFIFAAIWIESFVYYELSRPLEDMTKALQTIKAGVWEVDFSVQNRISEIEDVRDSVKALLQEIEQYKIRFYEEELEKAKIHRQYLQLQLTPHFYTNCLKNAYYMLALKEYDNAEIFLQRLSTHLRYLLQQEKSFVTIGQEIDFVRNYVDMQKLMTSKPLYCDINVDEDSMDKEIPVLALQTFIENSVKYARNMEGKQLRISLNVRFRRTEEGNFLDITIKDNGPGYPKELLDVINEYKPEEKEGLGIGVINLQDRLRLFYGDKASWYFENKNGAVSELILPEKAEVRE